MLVLEFVRLFDLAQSVLQFSRLALKPRVVFGDCADFRTQLFIFVLSALLKGKE
jgi:hypothetical protein